MAPVELADWLVWMKKAVPEDKIRDPNKGGAKGDKIEVSWLDHKGESNRIEGAVA